MVDEIEQRVYALVRKHDGVYIFKEKVLTPDTDLDTDLQLEDDEAEELMSEFFELFRVEKGSFAIETYYPPDPPLCELLNPFKKREIPTVPDFTINMLIESAKAGRWLY